MQRYLNGRSVKWLGGVMLAGLGLWAARRALAFDIDFDPWDDAADYA
ncbi:hypothetical protein ABDK56_07710 [Sphingomonas sp. ASV193]